MSNDAKLKEEEDTYSACAFHLNCAMNHIMNALGNQIPLLGAIEQDSLMEVAITDVTEHTAKQT